MKKTRAALFRLAGILRLTRSDREIDEELRSHLTMLADEYRRAGLSDADAQRAAAAKFGSLTSAAEAYRDRRGVPLLEQLAADCRYAARSASQTRILSTSMILVLALGIGVTTTLVTLFHAVAFRNLPLPDPNRVVKLSLGFAGDVNRRVNGHVSQFSYPELTLYQDSTRALSGVAGFRHERATWFHRGNRRGIAVALVTTNYFKLLQVRPESGRLLADIDRLQPAAVISHRLWTDAFAQDPAAIGTSMLIDRQGYTVIGVAERSFSGTEVDTVDVWVPLDLAAPARGHAERLADSSLSWLQVVGRLAPGISLKSAVVEAGIISPRYDAMHPGQRTSVVVSQAAALDAGLLQSSSDRAKVIGVGAVVVALAAVLLLICTSNAAALLLARAVARQREIAIRIALGAGRWRVVQQLMTESALLALVAAALGVALCTIVFRTTAHLLPISGYFDTFVPDATVLSFASLAALAATILFGVAPAIYATRVDPLAAIKQDSKGLGERMPASRLRHWLVAGQVAISLVLLAISGLLARGVEHALRVDTGFPLTNLYAITVDVPAGNSTGADRANLVRQLSLSLHSTPGLEVGLVSVPPFGGAGLNQARAEHMSSAVQVQFNRVDAGYFSTLGVSNVAGRWFRSGDDRSQVIVNARLAKAFWGDERAAVGQAVMFLDDRVAAPTVGAEPRREPEMAFRTGTVVGVVPTLQSLDVGVPDGPTLYVPIVNEDLTDVCFVVRSPSRQPLERMTADLTRGTDAAAGTAALEERVVSRTQPARLASAITVVIGVLTLLVAAVGVYGIVAHSVVSRTHEIGVHIALGAPRARVLRLVLGSSLRAIGSGAAIGVAVMLTAAFFGSEVLEPILLGVGLLDPLAFGAVGCLLAAIMGAAAYLPARRALGVPPIDALRRI
jgi:putative ABC transport system permease protein